MDESGRKNAGRNRGGLALKRFRFFLVLITDKSAARIIGTLVLVG